jgi:hypothetical protein
MEPPPKVDGGGGGQKGRGVVRGRGRRRRRESGRVCLPIATCESSGGQPAGRPSPQHTHDKHNAESLGPSLGSIALSDVMLPPHT